MALNANDLIEISLNMNVMAQTMNLVWQYEIDTIPPSVNAVQLAEGWWNHVKAATRGLAFSSFGNVFRTVRLRQLNNALGDYAEYDVPIAEQAGSRSATTSDQMPPYVAVGVRLVVGTRVTRPGQKRIPFVLEGDNVAGVLGSALQTVVQTYMNTMQVPMTLGAPAATVGLIPIVTRKDGSGTVTAWQPITGYLINANLTTQNSRKFGRGI